MAWQQIFEQRRKWVVELEERQIPSEMYVIEYQGWLNKAMSHIRAEAVKDPCREKSLRKWATAIKEKGGMAASTDRFKLDRANSGAFAPKVSQGSKIRSFWLMSVWQKDFLERNVKFIFLDSTHKTARGIHGKEDVYLFTLYVKNQVTGKGAPAAFMITYSGRKEVIAHFLRAAKLFASVLPVQVVIDCDMTETNALIEVFKDTIIVIWCRFHISKAFANNLRSKVTLGQRG